VTQGSQIGGFGAKSVNHPLKGQFLELIS